MPKRIAPLTEKEIDAVKAAEKPHRLFDGGGLLLLITPDGGKRWRYKYRFEGRAKSLSFGVYPEVSLEDARRRRDDAKELLAKGLDPSVLRREEREREKAERLESERIPSISISLDGKIEIRKGGNLMRLKKDEAQFISNILNKIVG